MKIYQERRIGVPIMRENTIPIFIVDDLSSLRGPTDGIVQLPIELDWTPVSSYDLSVPRRVLTFYSTVLREARTEGDLVRYLNEAMLVSVWRDIRIPQFVRSSWEAIHPELVS